MAYGNLLTDVVQSSTTGTAPVFKDGTGKEIGTLCKAWVNFGYVSSAISIRSSYNVSSITRVSTGVYTVTFTNNLTDSNYSVILTTCRENAESDYRGACIDLNGSYSTSTFRIATIVSGTTMTDRTVITAAVFR